MSRDRDQCEDREGDVDDDGLPDFTGVGDGGDTDGTEEIEDMIDDDVGHDASGEEAVAQQDQCGADPA